MRLGLTNDWLAGPCMAFIWFIVISLIRCSRVLDGCGVKWVGDVVGAWGPQQGNNRGVYMKNLTLTLSQHNSSKITFQGNIYTGGRCTTTCAVVNQL